MHIVSDWLFGEERLWKPFWLGGLLAIPIGIIGGIIQMLGTIGLIVSSLIFVVYSIWIGVSVWNCAYNVDWEWWGHAARAWVILFVMMIIGNVIFFVLFI